MKKIIILIPNPAAFDVSSDLQIAYTTKIKSIWWSGGIKYTFVYVNCEDKDNLYRALKDATEINTHDSDYTNEQLCFMAENLYLCSFWHKLRLNKIAKELKGKLPVDAFNADKILVIDATDIPQSQEVDEKIYKPQTEAVLF